MSNYNNDTFIANLSCALSKLKENCTSEDLKNYIAKLAAGKENYSEDQFWETLHELNAFMYMTKFSNCSIEYEPAIGGNTGRNPEFRVNFSHKIDIKSSSSTIINNCIFDVEVKSIVGNLNNSINKNDPFILPLLPIQYEKREQLKEACNELGFKLELPEVTHIKNFLNNAYTKFVCPDSKNHFNLLFLNWTFREIENNWLEPYMLLNNIHNGLYCYREIGEKCGLEPGVYDRISAIFIYSCPIQSIMFNDITWALANNRCSLVLNPSLSLTQKEILNKFFPISNNLISSNLFKLIHPPHLDYWLFEEEFDKIDDIIKQIMFK